VAPRELPETNRHPARARERRGDQGPVRHRCSSRPARVGVGSARDAAGCPLPILTHQHRAAARAPKAIAPPRSGLAVSLPAIVHSMPFPAAPHVGTSGCAHRHPAIHGMATWRHGSGAQLARQRAHTHACRMHHGPSCTRAGQANRGQQCPAQARPHTNHPDPPGRRSNSALLSAAPSAALVRHLLRRTRLPGRTTPPNPSTHSDASTRTHAHTTHSTGIRSQQRYKGAT